MTQPLILHGMNSPNVTKVVLMLEECGLDYELRHVAVFKQEQFAPEFLALNPLGKVPVLQDPQHGVTLAESGAILHYLAEREGKFLPASQPATLAARAEVMQWLFMQMANYGPLLGQLNHFRLVLASGTHPYAEARYAAAAEKLYRLLDEHIAQQYENGREWIAGGDYSIADMAMQPWANYLEPHGFDSAQFPALVRWRAAVASRPAVSRALARSHEGFTAIAEATRKVASGEDLDKFFGRTDSVPPADFSAVVKM